MLSLILEELELKLQNGQIDLEEMIQFGYLKYNNNDKKIMF